MASPIPSISIALILARTTSVQPAAAMVAQVGPVRVQGDGDRLERALRNLGDNATRHADGLDGVQKALAEIWNAEDRDDACRAAAAIRLV